MTCKNCGATVTHNVCDYCGTKVEIEQPLRQVVVQQQTQQQTQQQVQQQQQQVQQQQQTDNIGNTYKQQSGKVAMWLACIPYTGMLGMHRFYVGKIGTGVLFILTGGLFGIGYIVDILMLLFDSFLDAKGQHLTRTPKAVGIITLILTVLVIFIYMIEEITK